MTVAERKKSLLKFKELIMNGHYCPSKFPCWRCECWNKAQVEGERVEINDFAVHLKAAAIKISLAEKSLIGRPRVSQRFKDELASAVIDKKVRRSECLEVLLQFTKEFQKSHLIFKDELLLAVIDREMRLAKRDQLQIAQQDAYGVPRWFKSPWFLSEVTKQQKCTDDLAKKNIHSFMAKESRRDALRKHFRVQI